MLLIVLAANYFYWIHKPKHLAYEIDHTVVFQNTSRAVVTPYKLFIRIPLTDKNQTTEFLGLGQDKYIVQQDDSIVTVEGFDALQPNEELTVNYRYKVKLKQATESRNRDLSDTDTKPGHDIESDDKRIIQLAMDLTAHKGSDEEKAHAIYAYVASSIRFDAKVGDWASRSAVDCLEAGGGVCGHKANLVSALCRAAGIPARTVSGLTVTRAAWAFPHDANSHAWNEIYIEGEGWLFADPTYGSSVWLRSRYWGDYDPYRVIVELDNSHSAFDLAKASAEEKTHVDCMICGPCYVMLTTLEMSANGISIRGDKLQTAAKAINK